MNIRPINIIEDKEKGFIIRDDDDHKRDLFFALRSRLLTVEEMEEVYKYRDDLNIYNGQGYSREEKYRELSEALLQQFKMNLELQKMAKHG